MNKEQKRYKGEKYIYLLMAYQLAQQNKKGLIAIGNDNGTKGGQNYYRRFQIQKYKGQTLLTETKTSASFANFSRTFKVNDNHGTPIIQDYMNEDNENCGQKWIH